ncbi:cell division cycle-associated protein 2 isoform X1 [Gadus chalcogrammus]|uniref:cell division cycle-associated protein 2 isoform X1 n=1 Tax=Gadus chalcogrammus TaxID=1042646 RepID=UPI0024C23909|nr:cell division cycle-associated protein 2 isoform X1 [Gadus chalcogrammus]
MASPEPKQAEAEGPSVLCETPCPVDFSQFSPSKFGISTQSFTPSSSKSKDKSKLSKIKSLRRSSIGARGSPGTNSLIHFMAQHRAKTPPVFKTPEAFKRSPFPIRVSSTLKLKMASFQSLMDVEDVEEGEHCDPGAGPKQDLSDGGLDSDKENCSPRSVPSKRRRVGAPGLCVSEISGASSPILPHFSGQAHPEETSFEVQSTRTPPPSELAELVAVDLPAQQALSFPSSPSSPPLLEMKPFVVPSEANSTLKKNKKQVRFGGPLTPEFFDKNLPPSTPLQKGTTPARAEPPTPGPGSGLRSLLKTPQRPAGWTPLPQPAFCSPTFGASPTLSFSLQRGAQTPENDCEKIVFPSLEETDLPFLTDEDVLVVQPLDLNLAFQESLTDSPSGGAAAAESGAPPLEDPQAPPEEPLQAQLVGPGPEPETAVDAQASSDTPIKKARSEALPPSAIPALVNCVRQKRKLPTEKTEPVRRSSRSAAKSGCGKMQKDRGWGSKVVDRSLYGHREYASKNPALSPIREGLRGPSPSPSPQSPGSRRRSIVTGEDPACPSSPTSEPAITSLPAPGGASPAHLTQKEDTTTSSNTTTPPSDAPADAAIPDQEVSSSGRKKKKRSSGPAKEPAQRRRRKVSVPVDAWLTEEPQEQLEATVDGPGSSVAETMSGDDDAQSGQPLVEDGEKAEEEQEPGSHTVDPAPTAPCPPSEGEAVGGAGSREEETSALEPTREEAPVELAPWQMAFTLEDVFKRAPAKEQRSVRRSLRNQRNKEEHCGSGVSGLAWLPKISPESLGVTRRNARWKNQGRRASASLVLKTPLKH